MARNPLALLLALAMGSAYAAADHFTDSVPAKADGVPLSYVGKDSTAATALTLTAKPDGGDAIGYLPKDSRVHVLLADDHGNHLVRTDYGITGWAQKGEKLEAGSEAFPALETLTETFNGDTLATIHYNPQLGKKQDSYYHYDANNKPVSGKAPADASDDIYSRHLLLETALKPGGTAYNLAYADIGANDLSYLSLSQKATPCPLTTAPRVCPPTSPSPATATFTATTTMPAPTTSRCVKNGASRRTATKKPPHSPSTTSASTAPITASGMKTATSPPKTAPSPPNCLTVLTAARPSQKSHRREKLP